MADNVIVGRFSGDPFALGAVGSTNSLNNLIINLLLGIGAGAGVLVSQYYGAKRDDSVNKSVHTTMLFSLIAGIVMAGVAFGISKFMLVKLGTKPEFLDRAILYFRIICIGIPANSVYNYGAAILRGTGNSKVPLLILSSAGLCNVVLNLFFVIVCDMSVSGVAIATIVSQYLSAVAVVLVLHMKKEESYYLDFKRLRIDKRYLFEILRFGVPSGIASSMFSIANLMITGSLNTLPPDTVTGATIASNIDALTLTSMNCFGQASMTFAGQNYGAKKPDRVKKSVGYCAIQVLVIGVACSVTELIFAKQLIGMYMNDNYERPDLIITAALTIITMMLTTYPLAGLLDVVSGAIKGLGNTMTAMMINLVCICGFRMVWLSLVFRKIGTLESLYLCYPASWLFALLVAFIMFIVRYTSFKKRTT